ncbi:xylulokinase [Vallitalea sp.]|uniref:xylulokinase n=1 Tax=Vallitalea sp. TaxID=1882829 RepID=UPI0025CCFA0F|nr:FGGY family carbohydrate kinase [Vallitalea sp.]MCT4687358.1 FGGY family carbohydrate kinase [Vallitalea sp.]
MKTKYIIGVDIGTQGTKVVLFSEDGNNIMETFVSSNLIYLDDGGIEQDPEIIYQSVVQGIRKIIEHSKIQPKDIVAVGMDGQMAGIMGIDDRFQPVGNYDSWLDNRCEVYMDYIRSYSEEKIIKITGAPISYAHGPKIIWRKKTRPNEYSRIKKFIMLTTYVAGRLVDMKWEDAYIDYTYLHFSGFGDVNKKEWSTQLLNYFDVDIEKMPRICNPWDIVGEVSEKGSNDSLLAVGTKIIAGCGDTAATILGAGGTRPSIAVDIAGTASVFACCTDKYIPDIENKTLIHARSIIDGLWTPLAYVGGGGQCLAWFKDSVVNQVGLSFDDLNQEASQVPAGSDGLIFIPHFSGRTCPNNPRIRGSWLHMNWFHTRGFLFKSIMESIAFEYKFYTNTLYKLSNEVNLKTIYGVGGGAKSSLFAQIKASVLNCNYIPMDRPDSATLACAVVAGYGVGLYQDIETTIQRFISTKNTISSNEQEYMVYLEQYKRYIRYIELLENMY